MNINDIYNKYYYFYVNIYRVNDNLPVESNFRFFALQLKIRLFSSILMPLLLLKVMGFYTTSLIICCTRQFAVQEDATPHCWP